MPTTDTIADFLARIRNAILARHTTVEVPASKMLLRITEILKNDGYIADYATVEGGVQGKIRLDLRYLPDRSNVIAGLKRASRPGQRLYLPVTKLPKVKNGLGIAIVSTSKGVMTDKDARKNRVGGEILCTVW